MPQRFDAAPLPAGTKPLTGFVKAPAALTRRLSMTGLTFPDQGAALQKQLKPGQRLVSARGDVWRWDGYSASADAPSQAAVRLSQRNRLKELEQEQSAARAHRAARFEDYAAAKSATEAARAAVRAAEDGLSGSERELIAAQDEATRAARAAAERASQLANLEAEIRRLEQTAEAADESRRQAEAALTELGDGVTLNQSVADAREPAPPKPAPPAAKRGRLWKASSAMAKPAPAA